MKIRSLLLFSLINKTYAGCSSSKTKTAKNQTALQKNTSNSESNSQKTNNNLNQYNLNNTDSKSDEDNEDNKNKKSISYYIDQKTKNITIKGDNSSKTLPFSTEVYQNILTLSKNSEYKLYFYVNNELMYKEKILRIFDISNSQLSPEHPTSMNIQCETPSKYIESNPQNDDKKTPYTIFFEEDNTILFDGTDSELLIECIKSMSYENFFNQYNNFSIFLTNDYMNEKISNNPQLIFLAEQVNEKAQIMEQDYIIFTGEDDKLLILFNIFNLIENSNNNNNNNNITIKTYKINDYIFNKIIQELTQDCPREEEENYQIKLLNIFENLQYNNIKSDLYIVLKKALINYIDTYINKNNNRIKLENYLNDLINCENLYIQNSSEQLSGRENNSQLLQEIYKFLQKNNSLQNNTNFYEKSLQEEYDLKSKIGIQDEQLLNHYKNFLELLDLSLSIKDKQITHNTIELLINSVPDELILVKTKQIIYYF